MLPSSSFILAEMSMMGASTKMLLLLLAACYPAASNQPPSDSRQDKCATFCAAS